MRRRNALFSLGLVLSFWALALINFSMPVTAAYAFLAGKVKLPAGTPVILRLTNSLNSATAQVGQPISFEVARNVDINGVTVIKQGALATAEIAKVEKPAILGEPGKIMVSLKSVKAVDGKEVPLRATLDAEGKNKQLLAIIVGVVLCILGLFLIKGTDATIPAGTEVKAFVDVDMDIEVS